MKKTMAWLAACMLILVLAACGASNQSAGSDSSGESDAGVTASEELVIKASNYEFDQPEYHLKKGSPLTLFTKTSMVIMAFSFRS